MKTKHILQNGDRENRMTATPAKLFLKQADAAKALGVSEVTLRRWTDCPRVYIGKSSTGKSRRVRYDLDEVKAWLKKERSC